MANSFISKNENIGFWITDSIFQIACRYMCAIINESINVSEFGKSLEKLLDKNAKGYFHSYMHLDLEELNRTTAKEFISYCEETKCYLREKGNFIEIVELEQLYYKKDITYKWDGPLETKRIIKIFDFLIDLVNDRLNIKVDDKINYDF